MAEKLSDAMKERGLRHWAAKAEKLESVIEAYRPHLERYHDPREAVCRGCGKLLEIDRDAICYKCSLLVEMQQYQELINLHQLRLGNMEDHVNDLQIQLDQANAALQAAQEQLAKHQQRAMAEVASARMALYLPYRRSDLPIEGEYPIPLSGEVPELPKE